MFETIAWERAYKTAIQSRQREAKSQTVRPPELRPYFSVKHLLRGEKLFNRDEVKTNIYRVESGLICLTWDPPTGPAERIEDLTPNTVFGLGYRGHHTYSAAAAVDSTVSCWPLSALPFLTEHSPSVAQRQAEAIEREIAHVRSILVASTINSPVSRLAAFLSYVSRQNAVEGRDPNIIDETVHCLFVAEQLKMDVGTLGKALVDLERRGLISRQPPHAIRICDCQLLDRFTPLT